MHGVKLAVYQKHITLSQDLWILAATMGLVVIVGTWSAKQVIQHISQKAFQRYVAVLLVIIASYMIVYGL